MQPFTIISYGEDGEPDVRCFIANSAPDAAALALIENGGLDLHGVYPGWIGERIEIENGSLEPVTVARAHARYHQSQTARLINLAQDLELS